MIPLCSPQKARIPTALALGSFDGLHEGHLQVINAISQSSVAVPTVVSFWPHPREVLFGETRLRLDLPNEKTKLLEPIGIQQLVLIPFNKSLASLSPENFITQILLQTLQAKQISIGENFRFGCNRQGNANDLKELAGKSGVEVTIVPILKDQEGRVSSSRIRSALSNGDLEQARNFMGRPYKFCGLVVRGKGVGKKLGWPTANLEVDGRKFLPGLGVYACWAWCSNTSQRFSAIMNLGPQPTIDPNSPSAVEVHLLNENIDLTGKILTVQPIERLRGQARFNSLKDLSAQIAKDADIALKIFNKLKES